MNISLQRVAILPAEPLRQSLALAVAQGFASVEIEGMVDRPGDHLAALADSGLHVACVRLGVGLSDADITSRRIHLEQQKRMVADAALLGATIAFLTVPDELTEAGRAYFLEGCTMLAAFAAGPGVRLHVLDADTKQLPNGVGLALQDPDAITIRCAGGYLGYVRLRDQGSEAIEQAGYRGLVALPLRQGE